MNSFPTDSDIFLLEVVSHNRKPVNYTYLRNLSRHRDRNSTARTAAFVVKKKSVVVLDFF